MSLGWLIYLAGVLGSLQTLFVLLSALSISTVFAIAMWASTTFQKDCEIKAKKYIKLSLILTLLFWLLAALTPSTTTVYMIAGVNVTQQIAKTPEAQKVLQLLNRELDERLKATEAEEK